MKFNKNKRVFPQISSIGDSGLIVVFGEKFSIKSNKKALALDFEINKVLPEGILETIPTLVSLMVRFDPLTVSYDSLKDYIYALLECDLNLNVSIGRSFVIPAVYGGSEGPELDEVADLMQIRSDQVISGHTGSKQRVMMLGFSAGCSYCGLLPPIWDIPRGKKINPSVPGGSLLIALRQTVFPASNMPTGWRRIGQSPCLTFNLVKDPNFLLKPGDEIRFEQISSAKAESISHDKLWETFEK